MGRNEHYSNLESAKIQAQAKIKRRFDRILKGKMEKPGITEIRGLPEGDSFLKTLNGFKEKHPKVHAYLSREERIEFHAYVTAMIKSELEKYESRQAALEKNPKALKTYITNLETHIGVLKKSMLHTPEAQHIELWKHQEELGNKMRRGFIADAEQEIKRCKELLAKLK